MSKTEKTEFIFNCVAVVLSIALAVFIVGYEHYAMERYTESLEQENELGGGIATSLLFIFFYLPVSACSCVLALILFGVTWRMYRVCGKRKVDFAADKARAVKTENRCLIALIVFKSIAAALALFLVFLAFNSSHETALSKTVFCTAFALYTGSLVLTIVNRRKIKSQSENLLHAENKL